MRSLMVNDLANSRGVDETLQSRQTFQIGEQTPCSWEPGQSIPSRYPCLLRDEMSSHPVPRTTSSVAVLIQILSFVPLPLVPLPSHTNRRALVPDLQPAP
jgi:hypothetical protein